jgi:hypothetical protein
MMADRTACGEEQGLKRALSGYFSYEALPKLFYRVTILLWMYLTISPSLRLTFSS